MHSCNECITGRLLGAPVGGAGVRFGGQMAGGRVMQPGAPVGAQGGIQIVISLYALL